jgi:hypothetical protein
MQERNDRVNARRAQAIEESTQRGLQRQDPGLPDQREKGVDGDEVFGLEAPVDLAGDENEPEAKEPGDEGKQIADTPEAKPESKLAADDKALIDAIREWQNGGAFPQMLENTPFEWVDKGTGALRRMTFGEMQEGVMRQSEFSSRMNQMRGFEQQLKFRETANNQFWTDIRDPMKLLEELEDRGYDEVFHKAAVEHSNRRMRMKRIAEAAGYAMMREHNLPENHPDVVSAVRDAMQGQMAARRMEVENRKLQKHNQMLAAMRQQQDNQQQQQQRMQQLNNSLAQLIPTAFKSAGVRNSPANTEAFYRHLNAYVASLQGWDGNIRRQHVITAAKMVREELEDMAAQRRRQQPQQQAPQSRALSPTRLGQRGSAQAVQPERRRPSEFEGVILGR